MDALAKLRLNDCSFTYAPENSEGLGWGFRCGFLGMLHREIIQQRMEEQAMRMAQAQARAKGPGTGHPH